MSIKIKNPVTVMTGGGDSVLYTPQVLTAEQQAQARTNIGAAAQSDLQNVINGATPVAKAANADNATNAGHATSADTATSASSADRATDDGYGRNIANTYVLKGEEGWGLNLYACTISFSTTPRAIYFWFPNKIFSFDLDDIAATLYSKGMRSIGRALPVCGIEPGGGQVVGMYSKNGSSITLAVITGAQLTEMALPSGTLNKSSYT